MATSPCKMLVAAALLAGIAAAAVPALAAQTVVDSNLTACGPDKTPIGGVGACGKTWTLHSGHAKLGDDGKLTVDVQGLVLNDPSVGQANGTPDGVDAVAAAVVCGDLIAAETSAIDLSPNGNAHIEAQVAVPKSCKPEILVRERYQGNLGGWLAKTGG